MGQFHFDPDGYEQLMQDEVPHYERLQDELAAAAADGPAPHRLLELGTGTGVTARRVLARHPDAVLVGVDASDEMLERARAALPDADLRVQRLQDPLPEGPFDLVFSALAVHHLDGEEKADLFAQIAKRLTLGGRFVLGDLVVPEDPADVVTPIDGSFDQPSTLADQVTWLEVAGLRVTVPWHHRDLAVIVAERPAT